MIHNKLTNYDAISGAHFSVGNTGHTLEFQQQLKEQGQNKCPNYVLVQVADENDQTRVKMSPKEARKMAQMLLEHAQTVENLLETEKQAGL